MAAAPKYSDEGSFTLKVTPSNDSTTDPELLLVQVILTSVKKDSNDDFLDRRILLTKNNTEIYIGRSSKRDARLVAKPNNAWFDSPVMSRNHARLSFSPKNGSISITDVDSLHGTYVNNRRIAQFYKRHLNSGDILRFGTVVEKGLDIFPACEMRIVLKFGSSNPHQRPVVFRVPDSSDEEDHVSDNDEVVDSSVAIMLGAGMVSPPSDQTAIDLTRDEASATKAIDASANSLASTEIPSDVKSDSVNHFPDWAPESVGSLSTASKAQSDPRDGSSSLVIDTDEAKLSNDGGERDYGLFVCDESDDSDGLERRDASPYDPPEYDPSEANDSYQEGNAESDDVESLRAYTDPALSSQTQKAEFEERTPRPGGADLDGVSMPTIFRPKYSRHGASATARSAKAEFFAAWEHNRRVQASQNKLSEGTIQDSPRGIAEDDESSVSFSTPGSVYGSTSNSLRSIKSSTCTTTAALLASGEKLLQAPPIADVAPANSMCWDDPYQHGSAFAHEMGKKSVGRSAYNTTVSEVEETKLTHDDGIEPPRALPLDVMCHSRKRKSDEISIILPTEVEAGSCPTHIESSQPIVNAVVPPAMNSDSAPIHCTDLADCPRRPLKRLRQAAEILGYATLGGVAVMSALIATAPAL
ncbi:hypothetical protein E4U55_001378 [Claviceps digitariae]|nr:hypothetical protein E4U55_001378 [Claviceps digitariae]